MKGKLFLTSAGLPETTRQYFLDLLDRKPEEMKVAFIPTAADLEEDKWFLKKDKGQLTQLGFIVEDFDLKTGNPERLQDYDIIWVDGGNTFYLLDWVRKSGFDKMLPKLLEQGKIYVGVSAGSILVGPSIELSGWKSSWDKNLPGLKDLRGLNIVPFAISPHFTEEDRQLIESKSKETPYEVIPLTDDQAVLVKDGEWHIVGKPE